MRPWVRVGPLLLCVILLSCGTTHPPDRVLLFQPEFQWGDGDVTFQGTGFLARSDQGEGFAVTSAHFMDFSGPDLVSVYWMGLPEGQPEIRLHEFWGAPGNAGTMNPLDLCPDFLVFPAVYDGPEQAWLSLDPRKEIPWREGVWLPDKREVEPGYAWVSGRVYASNPGYLVVLLDQAIHLESQSGTPVLSQKTGKVIGTVSLGDTRFGRTILFLAPACELRALLNGRMPRVPLEAGRDCQRRASIPGAGLPLQSFPSAGG